MRRRRPPAEHPYWGRLYDRAHPPALLAPIAIPTLVGLILGLVAGTQGPVSIRECGVAASYAAGVLAAVVFAFTCLWLCLDRSRGGRRRERFLRALFTGAWMGAFVFFVSWFVAVIPLLWYAVSSGEGIWLGMLYGGSISGVPAALLATGRYRSWKQRQRDWPRWERMRVPRQRTMLAVTAVATPTVTQDVEPMEPVSEDDGMDNRA